MNRTLYIFISIVFASVSGFFVLWLAVRMLEPAEYLVFASFWAGVYFLIGSIAGLQQEVARASSRASLEKEQSEKEANSSVKLAAISVGLFLTFTVLLSPIFFFVSGAGTIAELLQFLFPTVIGVTGYIVVAIVVGSLYGIQKWTLVAVLISTDALLRLLFVSFALITHQDISTLLWSVSLPFGLSILLVTPFLVKALRGKVVTDVALRKLMLNSGQAVAAAVGMSLLLSGFPFLLSWTTKDVGNEILSQSMFAITLVRAPFIVIAISLQSLLLVKFKTKTSFRPVILQIMIWFFIITLFILTFGYLFITHIFELAIGKPVLISPILLTVIILSGLLLSLLVVIGAAVLSRSLHFFYVLGWSLAAAISFAILLVPLEFEIRLILSLLVGPIIGLFIQLFALLFEKFRL